MNISVKNLTHRYDQQTLFENLSFQVHTGQKVCIQGQSGSGKSTLLKALAGLVVPTAGDIFIGEESLTEQSVWRLRTHIAYVPQEPDLGEGPVIDRIRRPFQYHANAHLIWSRQKLSDYCRQFRLNEQLLHKNNSELSGGEKQRVALIIALLFKRPVLVLDEPVSAVDKEIKTIVKNELLSDPSRTIFFASHENELLEISDETIVLAASGGAR